MNKNRTPHIRTSDFAKLCGTNKRTLIHYDKIGLFSPAWKDEHGYRYYSEEQCDVFLVINALKEIGMPLKEIKAYLDARNPDTLYRLLEEQRRRADTEIQELLRIRRMIETKMKLLGTARYITPGKTDVLELPEEHLILSDPVNSKDPGIVNRELQHHLAHCNKNHYNTGHPFGAMISKESLMNKEFNTYAYFFTKIQNIPDSCKVYRKPSGLYAVTCLQGDYSEADESYGNLLRFIDEHNYAVDGYSYKEGIIDEIAEKERSNFITKISIQICEGGIS